MYINGAPFIHSTGTMYITLKQAKRHPYALGIIMGKLRGSDAMAKNTRLEDMRWEYSTSKKCGPGIGPHEGYVTSLKGRAWHWWYAVRIT